MVDNKNDMQACDLLKCDNFHEGDDTYSVFAVRFSSEVVAMGVYCSHSCASEAAQLVAQIANWSFTKIAFNGA